VTIPPSYQAEDLREQVSALTRENQILQHQLTEAREGGDTPLPDNSEEMDELQARVEELERQLVSTSASTPNPIALAHVPHAPPRFLHHRNKRNPTILSRKSR